jgi:hypothetical protein
VEWASQGSWPSMRPRATTFFELESFYLRQPQRRQMLSGYACPIRSARRYAESRLNGRA